MTSTIQQRNYDSSFYVACQLHTSVVIVMQPTSLTGNGRRKISVRKWADGYNAWSPPRQVKVT